MKIICIGRNYSEHVKELNNEMPEEPVFFMKPDTALLKEENFYYPEFTSDLHHELEIVLRVCKSGKHISENFAHKYFDAVGLGIDFTARDVQEQCKKKGLPWEKAKAFDNSAPIGQFIPVSEAGSAEIKIELKVNGESRQKGDSSQLMFGFSKIISYVSQFVSLKTGDLIFTGTPKGVGPVKVGDHLEGFLNGRKMLNLHIK
jgi:acylpyruvate hydrolase